MYISLYRKGTVISEYTSSTLEGAIERFSKPDIEPICIAQDWNYEIVWLGSNFQEYSAKEILFTYLNEQINGQRTLKWDNFAW